MTTDRRLGLFGGTFDPIHCGHLDAAAAARTALGLDEVWFLPSCDPPHRRADPRASAFHRFALVALAIQGRTGCRASDLEIVRQGPSYTIDTLRVLHAKGWSPSQLFFIVGADAFADIATWHEYPAVLDAAHFVVIARPGMTLAAACARTPGLEERVRPSSRQPTPDTSPRAERGTGIYLVEAQTRDVSSTTIRTYLAQRQPIADFVPPSVAQHILSHHLYEAADHLHGQD